MIKSLASILYLFIFSNMSQTISQSTVTKSCKRWHTCLFGVCTVLCVKRMLTVELKRRINNVVLPTFTNLLKKRKKPRRDFY